MPLPKFVVAVGAIDGVNTVFYTGEPYRPGSTAVFINGQLKRSDFDDGWVETDPVAGRVDLTEAPRGTTGPGTYQWTDVVQIFFLDTSLVLPGEEVTPLFGKIEAVEELEAHLVDISAKHGVVEEFGTLVGVVQQDGLHGVVYAVEEIHGTVAEVCS